MRSQWHYYERWLHALQRLLADCGVIDLAKLDERSQAVLTTPRHASHQHAHPPLVAIDRGRQSRYTRPPGHGYAG